MDQKNQTGSFIYVICIIVSLTTYSYLKEGFSYRGSDVVFVRKAPDIRQNGFGEPQQSTYIKDEEVNITRPVLHEILRRSGINTDRLIRKTIENLGQIRTNALGGKGPYAKDPVTNLILHLSQQHRILARWRKLTHLDSGNAWGKRESAELSKLVQDRLYKLQNPENCSQARKLICHPDPKCGYGSQTHHLILCLIVAYNRNRTLILETEKWDWPYAAGWTEFFQPISNSCLDKGPSNIYHWNDHDSHENLKVLHMPKYYYIELTKRPDRVQIPLDIAGRLVGLHADPLAWWVGQIAMYIQRLNPNMTMHLAETIKSIGFEHPVVGIHVRRTDKIKFEAEYHSLEEYMFYVERYFNRTGKVSTKRIFLVTDDVSVLQEASDKYPDYVFINNENATEYRFSRQGLQRIITNLYLLAYSDFLVCTFSSNVCRLAYEMMQTQHVDASYFVKSVDFIYAMH